MSEQTYFEEAARMHALVNSQVGDGFLRKPGPMPKFDPNRHIIVDADTIPQSYSTEHGTSCQYPAPIPTQPILRTAEATMEQNVHLLNHIHPSAVIDVDELTLGVGVEIGEGTVIKCKKAVIGDFTLIGDHVTIRVPSFALGDYARLNAMTFCGGTKPLTIGRNAYIRRGSYIDSRGGVTIADNVGFGGTIWSHMRFGDPLLGCQYDTETPLVIEQDAWLCGDVTVSQVNRIGARALVLNTSHVTHNLEGNRTYAGRPARDVTHRFPRQFEPLTVAERLKWLDNAIEEFVAAHPEYPDTLFVCETALEFTDHPDNTYFAVTDRTYTKRRTPQEVAFLRSTLAKFVPFEPRYTDGGIEIR